MTDDQQTPETDEPTPATEGEQDVDVEGHAIGRPGGLQREAIPDDSDADGYIIRL